MTPSGPPQQKPERVPVHVAVIMDGNGRWAKQRGLPRLEGHQAGVSNLRPVLRAFAEQGVQYVTVYAFSTENWLRPREEVDGLMTLLTQAIEEHAEDLHQEGVRILHLGRMDRLDDKLAGSIRRVIEMTRDNQRITLSVAFDYGGRAEVLDAVRRLLKDGMAADEVTEQTFQRYLYTADLPDPDLIVRTGGEMRLSNFLLWQSAYAEFYATPVLWPDFGPTEVAEALNAYSLRKRRFGMVDVED
jgi:undecaprenyl diphosphate synthase